jgi:glycosyltransferase involved in cell wall biosynthesis
MKKGLVSVIMPVLNGADYIADAIRSVLNQDYTQWELLIVDNGSTDGTTGIVNGFRDARITLLSEHKKKGVAAARNKALQEMSGEFFCFLDADDILPKDSISKRINHLQDHKDVHFLDGTVEVKNVYLDKTISLCKPSFRGEALNELASLSGRCFCGISWFIRRTPTKEYFFPESWTHAEDLAFYLSIAADGKYDFIDAIVYVVRRGHSSAMSNLQGLENGYSKLLDYMKTLPLSREQREFSRHKVRSIMTKSYLKNGNIFGALKAWQKFSKGGES